MSGFQEILWDDKTLELPRPGSLPTFYPSRSRSLKAYPGIISELQLIGEGQMSTAWGYGSSHTGESSNSLIDVLIVVDDPNSFHQANKDSRPKDYDPVTGIPALQAWLNRFSPNFYPSEVLIDGEPRGIKYGVIGLEDFLLQARSGLRGREGCSHLYTAGRLQKAMLVPYILDADPFTRRNIDIAINQARIDGVWLALGLLPEQFDRESLMRKYVGLSYAADVRVEKEDKIDLLINQSRAEYDEMMDDLLGAFTAEGILEQTGEDEFRKRFSLPEAEVKAWLAESAKYSFKINYLKNPMTYGPIRGLEYSLAKLRRARGESAGISETRNSGIRAQLTFIPELTAKLIHERVPDLTPNQITLASAGATLAATLMAARRIREDGDFKSSIKELITLGIALALDFFDGSLAREINKLTPEEQARKDEGEKIPEKHNTKWGGMWDAVNDRFGAAVMGLSRIVAAHRRGDRIGEFFATLATLTNPLPALLRALGESKFQVYPESSNPLRDPAGFFGVHVGRTLAAVLGTLYPDYYLQDIADAAVSFGNIVVTKRRLKPGKIMEIPDSTKLSKKEYDEAMEKRQKARDDAEFRATALAIASVATAGAVLATHFILHKKKGRFKWK